MISIHDDTCDGAWRQAAKLVKSAGVEQESRTFRSQVTTETLELLHAAMTINDPRQRLVFSRPINPAFAIAEVLWIMSGSRDLEWIAFWNPLMRQFSDNGQTLRGAYGYRLSCNADGDFFDPSNPDNKYFVPAKLSFSQLKEACFALSATPHSRQVVLQIYDVQSDFPVEDGTPRSKDIPCNLIADLKVRDGKLHWMQVMRSNDLFWGTPYNFMQWTTIQEIMAGWLGLELGQYTHVASSLHVYQDHWAELKAMDFNGSGAYEVVGTESIMPKVKLNGIPHNEARLGIFGYSNWLPIFNHVLGAANRLQQAKDVQDVYDINDDLHEAVDEGMWFTYAHTQPAIGVTAYLQWVALLSAEVCRKLGKPDDAMNLIEFAGPYYKASWLQWFERKEVNNG